jgi:L-lactate dehydrogenase (cytochrome)
LTVQNTGQAMSRANNYAVESNMPPADPVKRVDIMDVEALAAKVAEGPVALCRCYKSTTFPYCDGSHTAHNEATGDNVGPLVVKAGLAPEQRGLDFKTEISAEENAKAVAGPRANNYGVASNMPSDAPVKIVDMVDIEDVKAAVGAKGVVSFCRCFNSKSFPLCDGSHGDHNEACGDNTGPVVLKNLGGGAPAPAPAAALRDISYDEVAKHSTPDDVWVVIGDEVYDLTDFAGSHPGGASLVLKYAGREATTEFLEAHPLSIIKTTLPDAGAGHRKGRIVKGSVPDAATKPIPGVGGKAPAAALAAGEIDLPPVESCINLFDFESVAKAKMALTGRKKGWDYYSSGADDEITLRENHSAFQRIFLKPRVLINVSQIDTSCTVLGHPSSFPVYLSAVALQKLGHPEGELNWVRAAKEQNVIFMTPTLASCSMEEISSLARVEGQTLFFQLYVNPNRVLCEEIVRTAEASGCKALFITVDSPQLGRRERDMRNKAGQGSVAKVQSKQGAEIKKDKGTSAALTSFMDPALCWDDIAWFQSITTMDIMLKGVGHAEDVVMAKQHGCKGVVLSNHGGRQLDFARSGIEVLPEAMAALREEFAEDQLSDFHVFVDGGVRRGSDVFKALCLGARAVGIGKPVAYANSAYGAEGISAMVAAGLLTQGSPGSHRTSWHPVEDPLDPLQIGKVP